MTSAEQARIIDKQLPLGDEISERLRALWKPYPTHRKLRERCAWTV
jgi:hypothetical protein